MRFFCTFWCFVFFLFVFALEKAPKRLFSCNFRGFSFLFPQKLLLFFLFCFSPCFPVVSPFKIPSIFFLFCPSTLFGKHIWGVSFIFPYLPFPLLMFACFFETDFPNIFFFKTDLFSFLVVSFLLFLLFVFMFYVSAFCYWYVFVWFLVALSDYEKHCFPCNSSVYLSHVG